MESKTTFTKKFIFKLEKQSHSETEAVEVFLLGDFKNDWEKIKMEKLQVDSEEAVRSEGVKDEEKSSEGESNIHEEDGSGQLYYTVVEGLQYNRRYMYKYQVGNEWVLDAKDPITTTTEGYVNNILYKSNGTSDEASGTDILEDSSIVEPKSDIPKAEAEIKVEEKGGDWRAMDEKLDEVDGCKMKSAAESQVTEPKDAEEDGKERLEQSDMGQARKICTINEEVVKVSGSGASPGIQAGAEGSMKYESQEHDSLQENNAFGVIKQDPDGKAEHHANKLDSFEIEGMYKGQGGCSIGVNILSIPSYCHNVDLV
ncbi:hypothetical protein AX774_g4118 [Zancudomyces culisetae]|uniref:Uncharacterized protein n=1 Tax=Zancudomyces culisetae TaxID=1213189 RepID=A0A1R1PNA6_ZANCU|nr:hypothetical protein AX774_g4118 [Zancudomyces culisetae]|eukprot:OMH82393.1 hypothetical protein AX774_g4118 [Zancudomyces culisetae]